MATTILRPEVGIAIIVYEALHNGHGAEKKIELGEISSVAFELTKAGIPVGDFGVYQCGKGYCSNVVDRTVGNYLRFGYASQRNPLRLTEQGEQVLAEVIETAQEQAPESVALLRERVHQILAGMPS